MEQWAKNQRLIYKNLSQQWIIDGISDELTENDLKKKKEALI